VSGLLQTLANLFFSFPAIPVWLGIQYNSVTIDPLDLWQLSGWFLISTMHRFFGVYVDKTALIAALESEKMWIPGDGNRRCI
jgi:hypothetical protein